MAISFYLRIPCFRTTLELFQWFIVDVLPFKERCVPIADIVTHLKAALTVAIAFVVLSTTVLRLYLFAALVIAAFGFGASTGMPLDSLVAAVNSGVFKPRENDVMRMDKALADAFRIEILPHNANSRVCTFASLHFCAATPNATLLEISGSEKPVWDELFFGTAVKYNGGFAELPDAPGLGIDLNEAVAAKHPFVEKDWHSPQFSDGAISDR